MVEKFVYAQELQSTNFRVLDPVQTSGAFSSSNTYRLFSNIAQIAIGASAITSFDLNSGFLYYPFASSPSGVSASAGDGKVTLSWTASTGVLGWVVSGYNVGRSTSSGGTYSYTSVGNVTSSARTGLTNGTTYYFIVRAEDAFGNSVATSTEVSSTPVAATVSASSPTPVASSGGGGGGGGGGFGFFAPITSQKVTLKGKAYPGANIVVFKDGATASTIRADINGIWQTDISVVGGIYTFSIYAIDSENNKSLTTSFTTNILPVQSTTISDIVVPPTIIADKSQVKYGNDIKFFGTSFPKSDVNVIINSENVISDKVNSDETGLWSYTLNSGILEKGDHNVKTQTITPDGTISTFSESLAFRVGDSDIAFKKVITAILPSKKGAVCNINGDINNDKKINLIDFSIMLFFWNQYNPSNICADINGDKIVNLFDFSIMLFWWTG